MAYPEIDCIPPGDIAYMKLGKCEYGKGRLLLFTWEQVEICDQIPMFAATLSERDLARLARAALKAAGNELYHQVEIPENPWGEEKNNVTT